MRPGPPRMPRLHAIRTSVLMWTILIPASNRLPQIFIGGPGAAMQGQRHLCRSLDLNDPRDIQVLLCFSLNHALHHPVHVPRRLEQGCRCQSTRQTVWLRQALSGHAPVGSLLMYFRSGSDVADLALDENVRINSLEGFYGLVWSGARSPRTAVRRRRRRWNQSPT